MVLPDFIDRAVGQISSVRASRPAPHLNVVPTVFIGQDPDEGSSGSDREHKSKSLFHLFPLRDPDILVRQRQCVTKITCPTSGGGF